jgi:hypothetical protein
MADRLAQELERHFQRSRWRSAQDLVFAHPSGGYVLDASKVRKASRTRCRPPTCGRSCSTSCATPSAQRWRRPARLCARSRNGWAVAPETNRRREIDRGTRVPTRRLSMTGEGRSTALADELAPRADVGLSARAWAGSPSPSSPRFPQGLLRTPLRKGDCAGISRKEDRLGRARAQRAASRSTRATGARGRPPARWRVRRPGDVAPPRGSFVG